ncbi:NAD(P)-binding protein [Armillaria mellea]|nr:NAD(P)-binding protein [Armillaria mellea]
MGDNSERKTIGDRVAVIGARSCAAMFVRGIVERPACAVVAILEPTALSAPLTVPVYQPEQFKDMLTTERVDAIVVTYIDALHHLYIIPCWRLEVLTEKPMTTDADQCRAILETVQRTGRHLTVTFNYRDINNPVHELVKRTIADRKIRTGGFILWLLDTVHGADYFRRWHRQKSNSGGLMAHKYGHHFDLVNRWIGSEPETVAGMGKTAFYGKEAGTKNGWAKGYVRARGSDEARKDPFAIHMEMNETLQKLYAEAESDDGYHRDMNVFGPDIAIEDDMSVIVRYKSGVTLTYHLTAYSPWEGYRAAWRLELDVLESEYRSPSDGEGLGGLIHGANLLRAHAGGATVTPQRLWEKPQRLPVNVDHSAHGGGDTRMLSVLFGAKSDQEVDAGDGSKHEANERDGATALAVGVRANESFKTEFY